MALFGKPQTRKPPSGPIQLDQNNPLTRGIVFCTPFLDGYGPPIDIVGQPIRISGGAVTSWYVLSSGWVASGWNFTNATTLDLGFSAAGKQFTVASFSNVVDASGAGSPVMIGQMVYTSEAVNVGWQLGIDGSAVYKFLVGGNNDFNSYGLYSSKACTLGEHVIIGSTNGTNRRSLYVDGELAATTALNAHPLASTGTLNDTSGSTGSTVALLNVIWGRELSAFEVGIFSANPWQIFTPRQTSASLVFGSTLLPHTLWAQLAPILAQ